MGTQGVCPAGRGHPDPPPGTGRRVNGTPSAELTVAVRNPGGLLKSDHTGKRGWAGRASGEAGGCHTRWPSTARCTLPLPGKQTPGCLVIASLLGTWAQAGRAAGTWAAQGWRAAQVGITGPAWTLTVVVRQGPCALSRHTALPGTMGNGAPTRAGPQAWGSALFLPESGIWGRPRPSVY